MSLDEHLQFSISCIDMPLFDIEATGLGSHASESEGEYECARERISTRWQKS
jgi:hypothetical protein